MAMWSSAITRNRTLGSQLRCFRPLRMKVVPDNPIQETQNSVEIIENMGDWFVLVTRAGKEQVTVFEKEAYALAYAAGQRIALNLPNPELKGPPNGQACSESES